MDLDDLLGTNRLEILPTPTQELRIPKRSWIIRPGTVSDRMYDRRRTPGVMIDWEEFAIYDPDNIFEALDRAVWTVGIEGEASYLFEGITDPDGSTGLISEDPFAPEDGGMSQLLFHAAALIKIPPVIGELAECHFSLSYVLTRQGFLETSLKSFLFTGFSGA